MIDQLAGLGRRDDVDAELESLGDPGLTAGRVLAQHRGHWVVAEPGGEEPRLLTARGKMREQPPVTGDWVAVDAERIEAWRKLAREQKWVDDRRAAASEREDRGRSYSRIQREARRVKGDD